MAVLHYESTGAAESRYVPVDDDQARRLSDLLAEHVANGDVVELRCEGYAPRQFNFGQVVWARVEQDPEPPQMSVWSG